MKVIELFSGIGAQSAALKKANIPHEVVAISEWSIKSIISYGEIHKNDDINPIGREDILKELEHYTFSMDTKTPYDIKKLKDADLQLLYKNHKRTNNLGSIMDMKGKQIEGIDLLTYSFPCQNLSNQGKQEGLYNGKSSSLLWQVGRLIDEAGEKPKVLLMENVAAILNNKHKAGFDTWKDFLTSHGYHNYVMKLKASHYGVPQNRERCFMISSLQEMKGIEDDIRKNERLTELTIQDILENSPQSKNIKENLLKYLPKAIEFHKTINGIKSFSLENYTNFVSECKVYSAESISPTITATGANSNVKIWDNQKIRVLSPRECWRLMGFEDAQFDKVKDIHSNAELRKQAGNSIVVPVLMEIFKNIWKRVKGREDFLYIL